MGGGFPRTLFIRLRRTNNTADVQLSGTPSLLLLSDIPRSEFLLPNTLGVRVGEKYLRGPTQDLRLSVGTLKTETATDRHTETYSMIGETRGQRRIRFAPTVNVAGVPHTT